MTNNTEHHRWPRRRLGEFFRIKHGYAFKGEYFSNEGHFIVLTPGNFRADGGLVFKGEREKYYSADFPREYLLKKGEFLIVLTDLTQNAPILGSPAFVPENDRLLHNQRLGKITGLSSELDIHFLYYLLNTSGVRSQIKATATGATVRHTAPDRIYAVEADIPPLAVQHRIASILGAYDDLIENNLRRIRILEEMVRLLYKEWFVDFRFPGHEKHGLRPASNEACKPTRPNTPGWFPSPLGPIPTGWELIRLDAVAVVHRGRSYKSSELVEVGGLPFVNLKCIDRDGGFRYDGLKHYDGPFKDHHKVGRGDLVIAVTDMTQERRIVARVARIPILDSPFGIISMDLVKLQPVSPMSPTFIYGTLRYTRFPDEVKQYANGANVLHLNPDRITEWQFPCPSSELITDYSSLAENVYQEMDLLVKKNAVLRQTRDLLLPKLISGQVAVEDKEAQPEVVIGRAAEEPTTYTSRKKGDCNARR